MKIKHLFIRGNYREDIFFDKVDMINAWNRLWLSAYDTKTVIIVANILTNHLHIGARHRTDDDVQWSGKFMHHYRMSLSEYFNFRYQVHGSLGTRRYGRANVIDIEEDGGIDLIDLIRYILRNLIHHGISDSIEDWEFSTYRFIFGLANPADCLTGDQIPQKLLDAYIPKCRKLPEGWSMTKEGMIIPPEELFPRQEIESLFHNKAYYLKSLATPTRREGEGESNERELCTIHQPCKKVTDQQIIDIIQSKSLIPVVDMSREQKIKALKKVRELCPRATCRQLERIFGIPFRTICYLLKKR